MCITVERPRIGTCRRVLPQLERAVRHLRYRCCAWVILYLCGIKGAPALRLVAVGTVVRRRVIDIGRPPVNARIGAAAVVLIDDDGCGSFIKGRWLHQVPHTSVLYSL